MTHKEIRRTFINFFVRKGHLEIPQSSLVPDYDPTLLLTNSGMAPLKPYFLGLAEPPSRRLTNIQRCLRTSDIESVGDIHHLTFFEMMGNWSIGDAQAPDGVGSRGYFKREAIQFAWELLEEFGMDQSRIFAGVFGGDPDWPKIPPDTESFRAWREILPEEKILKLPSQDSFWFSGTVGPCGPNTDILYDLGPSQSCGKPTCGPTCSCGRFLEIWNAGVFMMYNRKGENEFEKLVARSVDAGAGLERFALVLQKVKNIYETDLFQNIISIITAIAEVGSAKGNLSSVRVIADHVRAATFLAADGVTPGNVERGYVLRRLIRRAIVHAATLKISGYFLNEVAQGVIEEFAEPYPFLSAQKTEVLKVLSDEERDYGLTLRRGLTEYHKLVGDPQNVRGQVFSGAAAFRLFDSYGFPLEMTVDLSQQKNLSVDRITFETLLQEQKGRSRQSRPSEVYEPAKIKTAHTAAHLLNAALQKILGAEVHQMGQNIRIKKFSHDFNFKRKLNESERAQIEELVNQKIAEDLPVVSRETTFSEAKREGAQALFEEKYKAVDRVTLYEIGTFSRELCGGPHVASTGELKRFKIVKEEAVASGIRRIKGVVDN